MTRFSGSFISRATAMMLREDEVKRCPKCGFTKPKSQFSRNQNRHDGLAGHCKSCVRETTRDWYVKNREKRLVQTAAYVAGLPPDERKERRARYRRTYETKNPEYQHRRNAIQVLTNQLGTTPPHELVVMKTEEYLLRNAVRQLTNAIKEMSK